MNLKQLRAFWVVGRTGSFSRAATQLHVTQPAVSIQVRLLEEQFGVTLFDRIGSRTRLTAAGTKLQQYAQRIFSLVEEAEQVMQMAKGLKVGDLKITANVTSAAYYVPYLLEAFRRTYPGISVHLSVSNSQRVVERLGSLEADVGLIGGSEAPPELQVTSFFEDPLVLLVGRQHHWYRRRRVSARDLAGEPFVWREPGSSTRAFVEAFAAAAGVKLQGGMELESNEAVKRAVEIGCGVTILSASAVKRELDAGFLRAVPLAGLGLVRPISLVVHKDRAEAPLIRAFLEVARSVGRQIKQGAL
jgi:aminoethylphosphonate catabolism LysR family transcriptional regulator